MAPAAGPVASRGQRLGARTLDLIAVGVLVFIALVVFGDNDRPAASFAIAWFVILVYETAFVTALGATPGKLAVGLRVLALDDLGSVPFDRAVKRGAATAALAALPVVGWVVWLSSTLTDPLGRGVADRAGQTMVTPKAFTAVASRDLPGYADGARPPRMTALGRVGDLDVRARARLRRLNDAPLLVVAVGLLALAASLPYSTSSILIGTSLAWVVVFVIDETIRVHRHGATAGHRAAGLVIRSHRTGGPPGLGRSFARALVLGFSLYVPVVGWLVLIVSLVMIRFNDRGASLHDLAGGTVVVADPALDPEVQRQRAMQMRIGQVT